MVVRYFVNTNPVWVIFIEKNATMREAVKK